MICSFGMKMEREKPQLPTELSEGSNIYQLLWKGLHSTSLLFTYDDIWNRIVNTKVLGNQVVNSALLSWVTAKLEEYLLELRIQKL